jgi:CHAT domain-containing protein
LLNQYELSLSPSLTTLYHAGKRAEIVPSSIVALANPTRNLDYAEPEAHLLRNWFQDEKAEYKVGKAVTPGEILAALPEKDVWHFATHGGFDASAPLKSRLWLEEDKLGRHLTLEMIFETRGLGTPRLVVLSACETGLYDLTSYPFEFTGLPSGFMHAGAAGVIATLWPVNDLSTALLMGKFYEGYMGGGLTPSAALRAAQLWLRDATVPDLRDALERWGKSGRVSSIENMIAAFDLRVSERKSSRDFALGDSFANISSNNSPYSSPLYWGGFVHYGV